MPSFCSARPQGWSSTGDVRPFKVQMGGGILVWGKAHHSVLPGQDEGEEHVCDVAAGGCRVYNSPLRIGLDCRRRRHGCGSR